MTYVESFEYIRCELIYIHSCKILVDAARENDANYQEVLNTGLGSCIAWVAR